MEQDRVRSGKMNTLWGRTGNGGRLRDSVNVLDALALKSEPAWERGLRLTAQGDLLTWLSNPLCLMLGWEHGSALEHPSFLCQPHPLPHHPHNQPALGTRLLSTRNLSAL